MPKDARSLAVVDCGTNSTRLLIATVTDGRMHPVLRRTTITRLGAGVDRDGQLSDQALERLVHALEDYAACWRTAEVDEIAVCATSAVRDAANAQRFVTVVRGLTGVTPVVLSGEAEAALTFAGATMDDQRRRVVCDIGGGSTELIVGAGELQHRISWQLGSVRLRERYLWHDPPRKAEYAALIAAVDKVVAQEALRFAARDDTPLLAVAGTATTLAGVVKGVAESDAEQIDGLVLGARDLAQVLEDLAWLPARERLRYPAIVPGREDVVVAGGLLLARILAGLRFAAAEIRVADLLDGVALRLAASGWPPARRRGSDGTPASESPA